MTAIPRKRIVKAFLAILSSCLGGAVPATAAEFVFTNLLDSSSGVRPFESFPLPLSARFAVNDSGDVVLMAKSDATGSWGIYRVGEDGYRELLPAGRSEWNLQTSRIRALEIDNARIAYVYGRPTGTFEEGWFSVNDDTVQRLLPSAPCCGSPLPALQIASGKGDVDKTGRITFFGSATGVPTLLARAPNGRVDALPSSQPNWLSISDISFSASGTSAFVAKAVDPATYETRTGVYVANGGTLQWVVPETAEMTFFTSGSGPYIGNYGDSQFVAMNASGDLAWTARGPAGEFGLYVRRDGSITRVFHADVNPDLTWVDDPRDFVLDSEGNLYFEWEKEIVPGAVAHALYVWDGAQVSEVIGPGTELFGKRVATIRLSRDGINARNEIAFLYQFNDGQSGVALLTSDLAPVPEVSTLASLMTGLLLLGLVARLRRFH